MGYMLHKQGGGLTTIAFLVLANSVGAEVRSSHLTLDRAGLSRAQAEAARTPPVAGSPPGRMVVETPFAFTAVAFLANRGSDGDLTVRVSRDGRVWSTALLVPDDEPNPPFNERGQTHPFALDRVSALYFPESLPSGPARFVAFEYVGAANPPTRVTLHLIDAATSPERIGKRSIDDVTDEHALKPPLVRRAEWGARPPKYPYTLTLAKHLAIHHTAGVSDGLAPTTEECAARVRAIQAFHQDTRDWNDVGYSYLICGTGEVFQAREDEDDATDVWGAHDGFNRGSMSVSLMGYFHPPYNQIPTTPMLDSLVRTLAWMADIRGVDPLDSSLYEAYGSLRTNIYGHREVRATECPGNIIFAIKDLIRFSVAERLALYREGSSPVQ